MRGSLVCDVTDNDVGRTARKTAVELSERLGLRLVLACVSDGIGPVAADADGAESVTMRPNRQGAAQLLARLAAEYGVTDSAEQRVGTGDTAASSARSPLRKPPTRSSSAGASADGCDAAWTAASPSNDEARRRCRR